MSLPKLTLATSSSKSMSINSANSSSIAFKSTSTNSANLTSTSPSRSTSISLSKSTTINPANLTSTSPAKSTSTSLSESTLAGNLPKLTLGLTLPKLTLGPSLPKLTLGPTLPKLTLTPPSDKYYCYLLQSISNPRRTYVGYTVDPHRRLRQHNGEIVGGAKYTSAYRPWRLVLYITGFPDETTALQLEWRCHHPPQRLYGLEGRLINLANILMLERWTKTARPVKSLNLRVTILSDIVFSVDRPNITVSYSV